MGPMYIYWLRAYQVTLLRFNTSYKKYFPSSYSFNIFIQNSSFENRKTDVSINLPPEIDHALQALCQIISQNHLVSTSYEQFVVI